MATLVIEDGTNVSGANTYISETDAITYINTYTPYAADFVGYDASQFQLALIQAASALDNLYGSRYAMYAAHFNQALLFPRLTFIDTFGREWLQGTIPTALKQAQVEMAILIYNGTDPYAPLSTDSAVLSKSVSIAGALSTSVTYKNVVKDEIYSGMRRVERVLQPILNPNKRTSTIKL